LALALLLVWPASAQRLLDRVVARVDGSAITLTDVNAATAFGVIDVPEGADRHTVAVQRMIDRQLMLAEVARFSPPEPDAAAVDAETATLEARAGSQLAAVMKATGYDEARIRDMARDTLRIRAYLNQRFGVTVQVSTEEVAQYYRIHPEEFMRGGRPMSFDEAEPVARERAAADRRASTIAQWLRDLRARAEVAELKR
jgi:hypothetical protein